MSETLFFRALIRRLRALLRGGEASQRAEGAPPTAPGEPGASAASATEAKPWHPEPGSMEGGLLSAARRIDVGTVVDVGASDGRWSRYARPYFPEAAFLLIEAQAEPHEPHLRALREQWPRMDYVLAAAGHRTGTIHFLVDDPLSGRASEETFGADDRVVPMVTIDDEVRRRGLPPPYLIKLDTHGFEMEILAGARRTLEQSALLVIEAYNFEITPGCLRFHELCAFFEERGFRCLDIVDIVRRPDDGFFWQCDLFFARAGRPEFRRNTFT